MEGQTLSHYRVLERLGGGGMGIVYRARDTRLARYVALKVLRPDTTGDPHRKDRLTKEARSASALNHPNIVTIYDVDAANGVDFIAMEYVEGRSLASLIAEGPLPPHIALTHAIQIASALDAAHQAAIVHRDIKPANVMVSSSGHVKVLDFGIAKLMEPAADSQISTLTAFPFTNAGVILGTPAYMSPEQAQGHPVDARSDVFSFGTVLYEMLAGRRPFTGDSHEAVVAGICGGQPTPLRKVREDVPADLERIVFRCLQKDPVERYQSGTELLTALTACQVQLAARRIALSTALRRPSVAIATALVLVTLAGTAGWWAVRSSRVRWARQTALPEIARLAEREDFDAAFRLLKETERYLPDDPAVEELRQRTTAIGSIRTEPEGAEVYIKDYRAPDRSWFLLGRTPLKTEVPLEYLRWRIVRAGFEPLEWASVLWPGMYGAERYHGGGDRRQLRYLNEPMRLDTPGTILLTPPGVVPVGMIRVPGGTYARAGRTVELDGYWLDRYEVTNADFKRFVDAGGYETPAYWSPPIVKAGTAVWAQGIGEFRDKTGRPGPSTWVLSTYPEGQAEFPVSGVSWYEAAAYCAFAGKRLPTLYHWFLAAGPANAAYPLHDTWSPILGFSNFDGTAPAPGGRFAGLSPYGAYDMGGNVKEWVWNAVDDKRRYILGGAWNEPSYMFTRMDAALPLSRVDTYGFRCAKLATPLSDDHPLLAGVPLVTGRDYAKEQPVPDYEFALFKSHYLYDRTELNAAVEILDDAHPQWRQERASFDTAYRRERMSAHLFLPRNARPPYQAVVYFPAGGAFRADAVLQVRSLDFLVQSGRAVVYPIFQNTHERYRGPVSGAAAVREQRVEWFKDLARTLDYLDTRADVDRDRMAMYSFSTNMLPIFLALESRLKTGIAVGGTLDRGVSLPEVDPFHFAPRVTVPFLMLNGRHDALNPVETHQAPLLRLLGTPTGDKRHVTFESHHVPVRIELIKEMLDWLDQYLGPVARDQ